MNHFPIIALVGHSGSGKTTLMDRILERMQNDVFRIHYLTSRPWRDTTDDVNYQFPTAEEFERMDANGELATHTEYSGYHYGTSHENLKVLVKGFGIQAYTQQSIENMRKAGYDVIAIKITADAQDYRENDIRKKDDIERDTIDVGHVFHLHNSFAPGGLDRAVDELAAFILSQKKHATA